MSLTSRMEYARKAWPGFMRGRSLTGRLYLGDGVSRLASGEGQPKNQDSKPKTLADLQSNSPTNSPQKPEADTGSAAASKLPVTAASSVAGKLSRALVIIASTVLLGCAAFASPADAQWLRAVALVESSNDSSAIGDGGRARGLYQFHRDAWEVARRVDPKVVEYYQGSTNAAQSHLAAAAYLTWLRQRFTANGVSMPTDAQLYAAYNCGFAGFKVKYKFDVSRTPRSTQSACAKLIAALSRGAATK